MIAERTEVLDEVERALQFGHTQEGEDDEILNPEQVMYGLSMQIIQAPVIAYNAVYVTQGEIETWCSKWLQQHETAKFHLFSPQEVTVISELDTKAHESVTIRRDNVNIVIHRLGPAYTCAIRL